MLMILRRVNDQYQIINEAWIRSAMCGEQYFDDNRALQQPDINESQG